MRADKKIRLLSWILVFAAVLVFFLPLHNVQAASDPVSDASKGNFRKVQGGSLGKNNLYRSRHPADGDSQSPAFYANKLAKSHGIRAVLNLSDSKSKLEGFFEEFGISTSYYYRSLYIKGKVYTADMHGTRQSTKFQKKIAAGLRYFTKNQGPYLIHCRIGRDRTGLVVLILESLMGASYDHMVEDYAQSNMELDGISYSRAKELAVESFNEEFHFITGLSPDTDWRKVNLARYTTNYLIKGGMSAAEVNTLKKNLSVSYLSNGTPVTDGSADISDINSKETPAGRNLSISGKTILTRSVRAGQSIRLQYKVQKGNVSSYGVTYTNSHASIVKVTGCGKGRLSIKGLKKGSALITLYSKSNHSERVKIVMKVTDK